MVDSYAGGLERGCPVAVVFERQPRACRWPRAELPPLGKRCDLEPQHGRAAKFVAPVRSRYFPVGRWSYWAGHGQLYLLFFPCRWLSCII